MTSLWFNDPKNGIASLGGCEKATASIKFTEAKIYEQNESVLIVGYASEISDISKYGEKGFKYTPQIVSCRIYVSGERANDFSKFLATYLLTKFSILGIEDAYSFNLHFGKITDGSLEKLNGLTEKWADLDVESCQANEMLIQVLEGAVIENVKRVEINHLKSVTPPDEPSKNGGGKSGFSGQKKIDQIKDKWEFVNNLVGSKNTDGLSEIVTILGKYSETDRQIALSLIESILKN